MTTIEIPKVESLNGIREPGEHVLTVFHFLLTSLLKREQALLHAEYRPPAPDTIWYLRARTKDFEGDDEKLVVLPPALLQSCAARLALILDLSYKEGGHGRLQMTQEGHRHACSIFLSNCPESGYWIRAYGRAI